MSLINDALKRAKESQPANPPPAPSPQFRPAEPVPTAGQGLAILVPFALLFIALIGLFFLWEVRHKTGGLRVAAATKPAVPANPAPETKPVTPVAVSIPNAAMSPPVPQKPIVPPAAAVPVVSAPAPIRLQAIFYSPGHSSAIISGRTVRAGDVFKGFRVVTIGKNSATLASATATNVMTLEEQ